MDNMRPMPPAERAKKRLTAFKDLRQSIDYKTERLAMMEEKLGSIGSPQISDMPKAPSYGGNDRMIDAIARKMDLEQEIQQDIAKERAEYEAIMLITAAMTKPDERTVIQLRYLDGAKWEAIAEVLYSQRDDFVDKSDYYLRQTFRKHGTALLGFAEAEDELMARKGKAGPKQAAWGV